MRGKGCSRCACGVEGLFAASCRVASPSGSVGERSGKAGQRR